TSLSRVLHVAPLLSVANANAARPGLPNPAATNAISQTNASFPFRLSNTVKPIEQLTRSDNAILLRNALIDVTGPALSIPEQLRSKGDPGSYIVQARGKITDAFREELRRAGAEIISYVPNNAYLVRISQESANQLQASPQAQAVLPW